MERRVALKKVIEEKEVCKEQRLITTFDRRSSPALRGILRNNHAAMMMRDCRLKGPFPNPPRAVFRRGKRIIDMLCNAKLPTVRQGVTRPQTANGTTRWNKTNGQSGCRLCPFITEKPNQVVKGSQGQIFRRNHQS